MQINKVLITDDMYQGLQKHLNGKEQKEFRFLPEGRATSSDFQWADAYVTFIAPKDFDLANIKWVHSLGAGVDRILYHRKWPEDVLLTRTIGSFGQKISEYCLSYILRDLQRHNQFEELKKKKKWGIFEPITLKGIKVIVFGTGQIGKEVAVNLQNFGAEVIGVSLSGISKFPFSMVVKPDQVSGVISNAQWVINTLPLTPLTTNLFDMDLFKNLNEACFINVGRGASVDDESLLTALEQRNLRLAILDVFRKEPLPQDSLFWSHPDIAITPHISALTSLDEAVSCFLETLRIIEADICPDNVVNLKKGY